MVCENYGLFVRICIIVVCHVFLAVCIACNLIYLCQFDCDFEHGCLCIMRVSICSCLMHVVMPRVCVVVCNEPGCCSVDFF